jgi:hypothetical protein
MPIPEILEPLPALTGPQCVDLHREEALVLPQERVQVEFRFPIRVIMDEGRDLGEYAHRYWNPAEEAAPGLRAVAFRIPSTLPARLVTLAGAVRETSYVVTVGRNNASLRATFEEGEDVLQSLRTDLGFYLDDGVETPEDAKLAALGEEHADTLSIDRLSAALYDYGRLGQELGPEMVAVGMETWNPATVDRAFELHAALDAPAPRPDRADIDLRNRLLTLLLEETAKTRRAAEYLWARKHPQIYRFFVSAYLRNQKLAARRRAAQQATADSTELQPTPPTAPVPTA